ncbi:MmpS family transport accessory protein [Actinoplanes sp. G11-F43]|uniref:MmpS family transport accessory protein n=1 Tax=Actinoplanes sp. G11-F43 TaxID=3424130 RepID=UPI003D33F48D
MSDPNEPRQPPRPPTFTPPGSDPEYPPTSQFPPVSPASPAGPAGPAGPTSPAGPYPPSYSPGTAQVPPHNPAPHYDQTAGWAAPPPGYEQPGYAPPGYEQPGYPPLGYGPPQPPPRKSAVPMIALVLAIALLLCGGVGVVGKILVDRATDKAAEITGSLPDPTLPALPTEGPDLPALPTDLPELPGLPTDLPTGIPGLGTEISVTYEVTGDGPAEIVYAEEGSTPKRVGNAELPWKITTKLTSPATVYVVAIRAGLGDGGVRCRATVDGEQVAEHSAEGTLATANCTKLVIE